MTDIKELLIEAKDEQGNFSHYEVDTLECVSVWDTMPPDPECNLMFSRETCEATKRTH